tara:strand:- start:224 stop:409 length:186 start_codon:yes stop_codon:yes gene_type:complete
VFQSTRHPDESCSTLEVVAAVEEAVLQEMAESRANGDMFGNGERGGSIEGIYRGTNRFCGS